MWTRDLNAVAAHALGAVQRRIRALTKPATSFPASARRVLLNVGVLALGLLGVGLVQLVSHKLLGTVASFWAES